MKNHPKAFVVTDIKNRNAEGLKTITALAGELQHRFIPQIMQPETYKSTKELGYKHIIWTLYQFKGGKKAIIKHTKEMDPFALTMPVYKAKQGLAKEIDQDIPIYVHTINDLQGEREFQTQWNITSIYTDFLNKDLVPEAQ
mgnify:CR=1 FL=1